jgi:hypothetical protein
MRTGPSPVIVVTDDQALLAALMTTTTTRALQQAEVQPVVVQDLSTAWATAAAQRRVAVVVSLQCGLFTSPGSLQQFLVALRSSRKRSVIGLGDPEAAGQLCDLVLASPKKPSELVELLGWLATKYDLSRTSELLRRATE